MRFLFLGDVVGRPGREAVLALVPKLRQTHRLDAVVVNCENSAGGKGVTPEIADAFLSGGVDVLTGGNHVWAHKDIDTYLEHESRLVRPANYPRAPGAGSYTFRLSDGRTLGVIQVEGRVFMRNLECPFRSADRELSALGRCTAVLVDVHCEASSEKQALGFHLAGRVSAVIGSHTHVPTADARVLPGGTAFQTDAGMCGPYLSVIGMDAQASIEGFLTHRRSRRGHQVGRGDVRVCGAMVDVDDATGKAREITSIQEAWAG